MIKAISDGELRRAGITSKPIEIDVQYTYLREAAKNPIQKCWTPPVGWVYDYIKKEWVKTGIYKRSTKASDCYWEPDPRFKKYKKWKKEEGALQKLNKDYVHPELQKFKEDCWRNRLSGFWFSNNGIPTYITGTNWFYLSCWEMDEGLPSFRMTDVNFFYLWECAREDENCYGIILLTKRRMGKTYIGGCIAYELTSRNKRFRTGIQSKNDDDAYKVYEEHIFFPFKSVPYFFKPDKINLPAGGKAPVSGMKFNSGKADEDEDEDGGELMSSITYRSRKASAYDGYKMKYYYADEVAKCEDLDVYVRWNTVRKCLVDNNHKVIGRSLQTTTVEDMEKGGGMFKKLWDASDQGSMKNGKTKSGLWKMFIPCFKTKDADKYGFCDEEANKEWFYNERELQDRPREKSMEIRQNPFFEEEAFRSDSSQCVFNPLIIDERADQLNWVPTSYKIGNMHWKDGIEFGSVVFVENPNGRCCMKEAPPEDRQNLVIKRSNKYFPDNNSMYCGGVDTYDHRYLSKESEKKMSFGSITILKKPNPLSPSELDGGPVFFYLFRPDSPEIFWADVLKTLWYYGCFGLVETNKPGLLNNLEDNNCDGFVPLLPGKNTRGIATTNMTNNLIFDLTDQFISEEWEEDGILKKRINTVFFPQLLSQWKEFTPSDTTAYDGAMSFGLALMLLKNSISKSVKREETKDIGDYFRFMRSASMRLNRHG